jgi:hypothetical protein
MRGMKHCPKCGSTNINPLVFYRPSIWKCSDCGYEGAFIIEGSVLTEKMQEHYRQRYNIISWIVGNSRVNNCDGLTDNWPKASEGRMESVATVVKDNDYVELRL